MIKIAVSIGLSRKSSSEIRTKNGRQLARPKNYFSGFSLLESLISLSLSLFILISALEVMTQAKRIYSHSQSEQETALGAAVALEKIREDLEQAGAGLDGHRPEADCWPIKVENSVISMYSGDITVKLAADIEAGQTSVLIIPWSGSDSKLRAGRTILFAGQGRIELVRITGVLNDRLIVSPAFSSSFRAVE
jgi:Tfp pilus assembly protein PilW